MRRVYQVLLVLAWRDSLFDALKSVKLFWNQPPISSLIFNVPYLLLIDVPRFPFPLSNNTTVLSKNYQGLAAAQAGTPRN